MRYPLATSSQKDKGTSGACSRNSPAPLSLDVPSFAPLLPTRRTSLWADATSNNCSAHELKQEMSDDATTTALPAPLRSISKPPFPSVAASPGSRNKRRYEDLPPSAQSLESPAASSFTDLFVGLERPRLRGREPRVGLQSRHHHRTHADGVVDVDAQVSQAFFLSPSCLSLHQICSTSYRDGAFSGEKDIDGGSDENTIENEDGANSPTVYRSPQLPHWWRSIATPVPGTRVSLRPDTCRLAFWWIDRLGFEAYEIIRVVLQHSLEGVVRRCSGETAVVVEFRILPKLLKSTSYVVTQRSRKQCDGPPSLVADANTSASSGVPLPLPQLGRAGSAGMGECSRGDLAELATSMGNGTIAAAATPSPPSPLSHFQQPEATGSSSNLSPGAHPLFSFAVSSTAVTLAGRPADSSAEHDPQWPVLDRVLYTTTSQQQQQQQQRHHESSPLPVTHTSPQTGAAAAETAKVNAADFTGRHSEAEVDAWATNGSGGGSGECARFWAPTSVETVANRSSSSVLPVAVPLMRCLIQDDRPTTKPDTVHDTGIIGGVDDVMGNVEPTSSMGTHGSLCCPSPWRSAPQPQLPCGKLPPTVNILSIAAKGTELERSRSRTYNHHSGGDVHLSSVSEEGTFLVHVESHHSLKNADVHQRRNGGTVDMPPAAAASNPLLSAGGPSNPALPGNSNSDWQNGSQRWQQPNPLPAGRQLSPPKHHHQRTRSSPTSIDKVYPDMTEKVVAAAAAAEAARLKGAVFPITTAVCGSPLPAMNEDDDTVVAILTLPISVCTPIAVVRLHAMHILHPLLRAITALHDPAFSASTCGDHHHRDNTDTDSNDETLMTAPQLSNATSLPSPAEDTQGPDYLRAVRLFSEAIESFKNEVRAEEALPPPPSMIATPDNHAPTRARDLSILYTVRSHLLFHASPTCLRDSLQDAEAALRCCPARDHINPTYEILAANLISLGYVSKVEDLAGDLWHRWGAASPLLLRLGRVTQVMVSYASIFLRQQLPTSTLHLCTGVGNANVVLPSNTDGTVTGSPPLTAMSLSPHSPRGGGVSHCLLGGSPTADSIANPAPRSASQSGSVVDTSTDRLRLSSPQPTAPPTDRMSSRLGHGGDERSSPPVAAASTATTLHQAHTLPYEVCPLPLGSYGRTPHNLHEPPLQSSPIPLSPLSFSADSATADSMPRLHSPLRGPSLPSRPFHPALGVCHRRLFLLEILFPSMSPALVSSLPRPVSLRCRGRTGRRGYQPRSTKATTGGGNNSATPSNAVVSPRTKPKRLVRAEDFMYDQNSMLTLQASTADTTVQWGTAPMCYFCRHIRLSATRRIQKDEVIFMERPAILMPFWPLLPPRSALASTAVMAPRSSNTDTVGSDMLSVRTTPTPSCCAHCGQQRLLNHVNCPGGCHTVYCSERCRQLALRLYHVVECGGVPPDTNKAGIPESGDDIGARVRRTVAVLQDVFSDWNSYLHHLAHWDTPSTRFTAQHTTFSSAMTPGVSPVPPSPISEASGHDVSQQQVPGDSSGKTHGQGKQSRAPPPILAVTAMRVVARLEAMLLSLALPLELLPQMQNHPAWAAERHAGIRSVARTLRQRGLMVPTSTTPATPGVNLYCTHVDPHRLLLLEVLLQQLSVPFFADFNYRASPTVWEGLRRIPCEVTRSSRNAVVTTGHAKSVVSPVDDSGLNIFRSLPLPYAPSPISPKAQQKRNCFVELTPAQLEEMLCNVHSMVHRVYRVVAKELVGVPSIPLCGAEAEEDNSLDWGLPGRWNCVELLGFLSSTRAFQQISDFALTSWAVVYPRDTEPSNVAAAMATENRNVPQPRSIFLGDDRPLNIPHHPSNSSAITNDLSHANPSDISSTVAVPLVVMSPWSCLTVDLRPILGNVPGGVIHSRFMLEHEQRRCMLAYCAAAAGCRGGDDIGGGSGNEDSFLSVHSASSPAAVLTGDGDDSARAGSLHDDLSLQLLEEAARRNCSNLHISLVYTPSTDPAVLAVAKKNITVGDVLWWESLNCREYLSALL